MERRQTQDSHNSTPILKMCMAVAIFVSFFDLCVIETYLGL